VDFPSNPRQTAPDQEARSTRSGLVGGPALASCECRQTTRSEHPSWPATPCVMRNIYIVQSLCPSTLFAYPSTPPSASECSLPELSTAEQGPDPNTTTPQGLQSNTAIARIHQPFVLHSPRRAHFTPLGTAQHLSDYLITRDILLTAHRPPCAAHQILFLLTSTHT
jgi:hypothetical protein